MGKSVYGAILLFKKCSSGSVITFVGVSTCITYFARALFSKGISQIAQMINAIVIAISISILIPRLIKFITNMKITNLDEEKSAYHDYLVSKIASEKAVNEEEAGGECVEIGMSPILRDEIAKKKYIRGANQNPDIFAQMLKNNDESKEYFKISKRQARNSHTIALIACIAGVALLGIAVVVLLLTGRTDFALIPAISGAITEVVSGTVLWVYNKSAAQLNHYYDALHENERYLSVVNLVSNLSQDKQDVIYMEIIRSQLNYITQGSMRDKAGVESIKPSKPSSDGDPSGKLIESKPLVN